MQGVSTTNSMDGGTRVAQAAHGRIARALHALFAAPFERRVPRLR
ncbi:hypothetical protein B0G84_4539 [Paraburkholderia sp. BL8N3]|jgi:hypothetical protein|nr:hypothetical protein [Paraburkholderia sp. BL8N3]TCK39208.1 hypothetical protein B0G84_4539 [Paraburkholderia sp. BL8N3]